jgi:hypothetical protein
VASVTTNWGEATTDYERTARFIEAMVVVAMLLWGIRLVRSRPKADAQRKVEGSDPPAS